MKGLLARHAGCLSGAQFEEFCVAWLEASRESHLLGGILKNVQTFGSPGEKQDGIDILCDVWTASNESAEGRMARVVFQCKRVKSWTEKKTRDAIKKLTHRADECVLILACAKSASIQRVIDEVNSQRTDCQSLWYVWFIDEIQQHIVNHLKNEAGARLVSTYFGSAISGELIGFDSASPLLLAGARFTGQSGALAHDRSILGRDRELAQMRDFLADDTKRALILSGEGGQGKTRLLREFAHRAAEEQPSRCVRWLDECLPETMDEALQKLPRARQWILILDDIHRWNHDPARLFQKLVRHGTRLKIVIGTRPLRRREMEMELNQSGYLAKMQEILPELKALKRKTLLQIATQSLEQRWKGAAGQLVAASGSNLLVLQLGVDYLNGCEDERVDLHASQTFRRDVLDQLIIQKAAAQKVGHVSESEVDEILDLIALLSSAPWSEEVHRSVANIAGISTQNLTRVIEHFELESRLEVTRSPDRKVERIRLNPDVLSDYRACRACYDESGAARDLPHRLWEALSQPQALLAPLLRNLSEAEYLQRLIDPRSPKVTGPLTHALLADYVEASWSRRVEMMNVWKSVAEYQPQEALQQIKQAIRLGNDRPAEKISDLALWLPQKEWVHDHASILNVCADILAIIGAHSTDLCVECLELLWDVSRLSGPKTLEKVAEICALNRNGPVTMAEKGIHWIKSQIQNVQALADHDQLGGLLHQMLDWTFRLEITEHAWDGEDTISTARSYCSLISTRPLRAVALEIVESWLHSPVQQARLAAAAYFRHFLVLDGYPLWTSHGGTAKSRSEWNEEVKAATAKLKAVLGSTTDPSTLWAIRHMLINASGHMLQPQDGHHEILDLLKNFPNSFELRIHRLLLSSDHTDAWDTEEWHAEMAKRQTSIQPLSFPVVHEVSAHVKREEQMWADFVNVTTAEILSEVSSVDSLLGFLEEWVSRLAVIGHSNFWAFLAALKQARPALLIELADEVLGGSSAALDHFMKWLLGLADGEHRQQWSLACLQHERETLVLVGVEALWFCDAMSEAEWMELQRLATHSSPNIRESVLQWATDSYSKHHDKMEKVFGIVSRVSFSPDDEQTIRSFVRCLGRWINPHCQGGGIPHGDAILDHFIDVPKLHDHQLDALLSSWSRQAPEQCIRFFEARLPKETEDYHALPHELKLHSLSAVPEIQARLNRAFCTYPCWFKVLARGAWETYLAWLEERLPAFTGDELVCALEPIWPSTSFAFRYPKLTEKLLAKANAEGLTAKGNIRSYLMNSLDPGMHSFTPGVPREHDVANRERALELSKQHRHRPLLREFYLGVVDGSEKRIAFAQSEESW